MICELNRAAHPKGEALNEKRSKWTVGTVEGVVPSKLVRSGDDK